MKSHFSRVVALGVLFCVSLSSNNSVNAQKRPANSIIEAPPLQITELSSSSIDAIALLGVFHHKMNSAKSYKGRTTVTLRYGPKGENLEKRFEIQSSWRRTQQQSKTTKFPEELIKSSFSIIVHTTPLNSKEIIEKWNGTNDGVKFYILNETKNIWSERNQNETDVTWPLCLSRFVLNSALTDINDGNALRVELLSLDGTDWKRVTSRPNETGLGKTWEFESRLFHEQNRSDWYWADYTSGSFISSVGDSTYISWNKTEFDVDLPDSSFQWKVPEGAKKVAPETISVPLDLH